jgi:hypothetical protein
MIVKAVVLFLIAMLALGMLGKLRRPTLPKRGSKSRDVAVQTARKCSTCDTYMIGSTKAECGRPDCPSRRQT